MCFNLFWACNAMLMLLAVLSQHAYADEPSVPRRWAILTSVELRDEGFADLLTVRLSQTQGIKLVEREAIDRVLAELRVNATGLVDPAKAVEFGRLVAADVILYAERDARAKPVVVRLRLIETRTGVRFLDTLVADRDTEKLVDEAVAECQVAAQQVLATKPDERRFVGLLGITSEQTESLDAERRTLETFLEVDLARLPGVVMLEREQLRHLTAERDLTGLDLQLRASTFVIEGGLRREYRPDRYQLTLKVTRLSSGESQVLRLSSDDGKLLSLRASALNGLAQVWEKKPLPSRHNDTQSEAAKITLRRDWLRANKRYTEAVRMAEAAFALSPTDENALAGRVVFQGFVMHQPFLDVLDRIEVARRAHEVDLWRFEQWLNSPGSALLPPDAMSLFPHVAVPQEGEQDSVHQARVELDRTRLEKMAKVERTLRERNLPTSKLLLARLAFANYFAETPEEFCRTVLRLQQELERQGFGDQGGVRYDVFLSFLWQQATLNDHEKIHPQHRWKVVQLKPLTDAFTRHRDPMIQMLGQHVLAGERGEAGAAAARRCFELVFDPRLETSVISNRLLFPIFRSALGRPWAIKNHSFFESCFETVLARCEQAKDATVLNRLPPELNIQLLRMATADKRIDWYVRWMRLVETSKDPSQIKSTIALQRWAANDPVLREHLHAPSASSTVWDQYQFKTLPIRSDLGDGHLMGLGVDRRKKTDDGQLFLARMLAGPDFRLVMEQVAISGGKAVKLNTGLRFGSQNIFGRSATLIAANQTSVFVWCGKYGLGVVRDGTETLVGEQSGLPKDFLGSMAWFEDRLYLSFPKVFLSYDPKTGKSEQLASSHSVTSVNPLDGGKPFFIQTILPDPQRRCLWLLVDEYGVRERHGVWKYSPDNGEFRQVYRIPQRVPGFKSATTMSDLTWSGEELFFFEGRRWVVIDPKTDRATPLDNYAKFELRADGVLQAVRFVKIGDHIVGANGQLYTPDGKIHRHKSYGGSVWHFLEPHADGFIAGRKGQGNDRIQIVRRRSELSASPDAPSVPSPKP